MPNQLNFNLLAHLSNRRVVLFSNFQRNKVLVGSQYNFKGNPTVYFMACFIKTRMCYFPLEKVVELTDEKVVKRLKKNNGKLKKFAEKDEPPLEEPAPEEAAKWTVRVLKDYERYLTDHMNSVGILKKAINNPLANEVG